MSHSESKEVECTPVILGQIASYLADTYPDALVISIIGSRTISTYLFERFKYKLNRCFAVIVPDSDLWPAGRRRKNEPTDWIRLEDICITITSMGDLVLLMDVKPDSRTEMVVKALEQSGKTVLRYSELVQKAKRYTVDNIDVEAIFMQ